MVLPSRASDPGGESLDPTDRSYLKGVIRLANTARRVTKISIAPPTPPAGLALANFHAVRIARRAVARGDQSLDGMRARAASLRSLWSIELSEYWSVIMST